MPKHELLKKPEVLILDGSIRLFGANGLFTRLNLGLLLDTLGPLRSCFDFHGVILSTSIVENSLQHTYITKHNRVSVVTETRKG